MTLQEQLFFDEVIDEADGYNRSAQEELHSDVEAWFNSLTPHQRDRLGAWIDSSAHYDTMVALSAAAGDWHRRRIQELQVCNDGAR
jgi:hypothetical protein